MRHTLVFVLTALLLAAPAGAAHRPKPSKRAELAKITHSGKLVKRTASSVTVKDGDRTVTCSRTDSSPDLGGAKVGKDVKISCRDGVLVGFEHALSGTAAGTITALTTTSLTVRGDERDVTCTLGDGSPKLGDFHVGDKVKLACANGVLTAIAKLDVTTITTGQLTGFFDGNLTVQSDGGESSCARGASSPTLDGFRVGNRVKMTCVNGVLTALVHADT